MTQLELGNAADMTEAYISQIENGRINVTLETMERLAAPLCLTIQEMFNGN